MSFENTNRKLNAGALGGTVTLLLLLIIPQELKGAPSTDIKASSRNQREKSALKACLAGDMKGGIELLAELYADTNDLTYIYNQARCYQQNNEPELALNRFREFLRKGPELNPKDQAALDRNMEECQRLIAEGRAAQGGGTVPPKSETTDHAPELPSRSISPIEVGSLTNQPKPQPGRDLKVAGIITASCGVGSIGIGLLYYWRRAGLLEKVEDKQKFQTDDDKNKLSSYKTISRVGYGVGAAAIATGVTLYLLGVHQSNSEPSVAWLPALLPGGATLTLRGRF
jgi:hypothetical protein